MEEEIREWKERYEKADQNHTEAVKEIRRLRGVVRSQRRKLEKLSQPKPKPKGKTISVLTQTPHGTVSPILESVWLKAIFEDYELTVELYEGPVSEENLLKEARVTFFDGNRKIITTGYEMRLLFLGMIKFSELTSENE